MKVKSLTPVIATDRLADPNGIPVNISQLIEPANEYMPYFRS